MMLLPLSLLLYLLYILIVSGKILQSFLHILSHHWKNMVRIKQIKEMYEMFTKEVWKYNDKEWKAFDFCFRVLQHILGNFWHGQLP